MRYGIGVPAFGEHGNGHDAADALPKLSLFADRIHDFAQDGRFRQCAATQQFRRKRPATLHDLTLETGKFVLGGFSESRIKGIAGFQLL